MFSFWKKTTETQSLDEGYIDCPECRKRQPARLTRQVESHSVYFVPVSSSEGPELLECQACGSVFARTAQCAFSHEKDPSDWPCFKCKKPIPHSRIDCPHCGFRFTGR